MSQTKRYPAVVVLCTNATGGMEFHSCSPEVTQEEFDRGEHYAKAKENASFNGFVEPMIAFDVTEPAAKQLPAMSAFLDVQPDFGITEGELATFISHRIEDGDIKLEDVPVRMARYGLMNPVRFAEEMQERMTEYPRW